MEALSLFATFRPSIRDVLALDPANMAVYRSLHYTKYLFFVYAGGKVIKKLYPTTAILIEEERPDVSCTESYNDPSFLTSLKAFPRYFASEAIRVVANTCSGLYLEKYALNYNRKIFPWDLFSLAVRGIHWVSLRAAGFKDPSALVRDVTASTAKATAASLEHLGVSHAKNVLTRTMLFDKISEWWVFKLGVFSLFQPLSDNSHTFIKESAKQLAAFTRIVHFTTHDVMLTFAASTVNDLVLALIVYDLIPRLKKQPSVFTFETFGVEFVCKYVSFCACNAVLTKVIGPYAAEVIISGKSVPVWVVASVSHFISYALFGFGCFAYRLVRNRINDARRRKRIAPEAKSVVEAEALVIASAANEAAILFEQVVGRSWTSLSEPDIDAIRNFTILVLNENRPLEAPIQLGMGFLLQCIIILASELPPSDNFINAAVSSGELLRINGHHEQTNESSSAAAVEGQVEKKDQQEEEGEGEGEGEDPCAICLREMDRTEDDILVARRCGHTYHTACLKESLSHAVKCPLCNVDFVGATDSPAEPFEAPCGLDRNGEPTPFLRVSSAYNDSAGALLTRCLSMFENKAPWGRDYRYLNNSLSAAATTGDDFIAAGLYALRDSYIDQAVNDRIRMYGQNYEPYTLLFPPPFLDEVTEEPMQTFTTSWGWTAICHVLRIFKPNTIFPPSC